MSKTEKLIDILLSNPLIYRWGLEAQKDLFKTKQLVDSKTRTGMQGF